MKFISCNDPKIFTLETQCFSKIAQECVDWQFHCVNFVLSPPPHSIVTVFHYLDGLSVTFRKILP